MKKYLLAILFVVTLTTATLHSHIVNAQTFNLNASEAWDSSCTGTVNSSASSFYYYNSGDTVNLVVTNNSSQTLQISITGSEQNIPNFNLSPGNNQNFPNLTVTSEILVEAQATTCNSSGNLSALYINGASGSMSCSVGNGNVWNIIGQYNYVATAVTLYRGSTYVATTQDAKGGPGSGDAIINEQFAGQATTATYYLYDGSNSSANLVGQATCPAIVATSTAPSVSKKSTTGSSTPATTSTSTTSNPTVTTPITTPTISSPTVTTLATNESSTINTKNSWIALAIFAFFAILFIFMVVSLWRVLSKAGRHGWIALIPIYSTWVIYEIGGYPGWWAILMCIPLINIAALVIYCMTCMRIAKLFGKNNLFGVLGLFIFSFVGWPILAFSKAKYHA